MSDSEPGQSPTVTAQPALAPAPAVTCNIIHHSQKWNDWASAQGTAGFADLLQDGIIAAIAQAGKPGGEVSLVLADDEQVRALNRQFRGIDAPTNVLSFPEPEDGTDIGADGAAFLGDIVLAFETIAREAGDAGKPLAEHACHLAVHGTLHLLGHDHHTDDDAVIMEALEVATLARLGIADPYSTFQDKA